MQHPKQLKLHQKRIFLKILKIILKIVRRPSLNKHNQVIRQNLSWGVKPGPYLVLPLLGPSTVRDTVALPVDWQGNVQAHMHPVSHRNTLTGLRLVNTRANLLNATDTLDAASLDRYSLMRDFYLKQRDPSARKQNDDSAGRIESYED